MGFSGSGGPPPSQARGGGGGSHGQKPYGFHLYEDCSVSGKKKKVSFLQVDKGESNCPVLILDEAKPEGDLWEPSVHIHERFRYGNSWNNYVIARRGLPEGDPLAIALQEPFKMMPWSKPEDEARVGTPVPKQGKWRWVFTCIKLKPFTFTRGPLKGKTMPYQRCLGLVGEDLYKELLTYRKAYGSLRGRLFNVSRDNGQFSARVGNDWTPDKVLSDEEMMEKFADAAADYGLRVEEYIRAMDYSKVLKQPTNDEMWEIAKWVAGERGVALELPDGTTTGGNPVAAALGGAEDENPDSDLPF